MKLVKILLKTVLWIVAIVVVALLSLPLWFGPVVKCVANAVAPRVVKTGFRLGHLSFNPYTCRFELGDFQLENPKGYPEKFAVTLGELHFDAETASLATDVIHIEEITVKDVFASYVSGGPGNVNNFQQIQYNVAGGREKYEQAQAEKAEKAKLEELQAQETAQETRAAEPPAAGEEKAEKRFIIDRLEISGLVVQFGFLPIRVPSITLTDLGKASGGATVLELGQEIWNGILKAAGALGDAVGEMAGQATEAASKAAGKAGKAGKALGDAANQAGKAAGKALDSLKKLW